MHLRYANDCVLSFRVPITGIHILSVLRNHGSRPSGLAKLWAAWRLQGRASGKSPTTLEAFSLYVKMQQSNIECSQKSFSVRSDSRWGKKSRSMCVRIWTNNCLKFCICAHPKCRDNAWASIIPRKLILNSTISVPLHSPLSLSLPLSLTHTHTYLHLSVNFTSQNIGRQWMYLFTNSLNWCEQIIQMRMLYGYFYGKDIILILIRIIVHSYVLTFI